MFRCLTLIVLFTNALAHSPPDIYDRISQNENAIQSLRETAMRQEQAIQRLKTETAKLPLLWDRLSTVKTKLEQRLKMLNASNPAIGFTMETLHSSEDPHNIVPFGRQITSVGIGYSNASYTFTAVIKGIYVFSWNNLSTLQGKYPCSYLALNGIMVRGYANYGEGKNYYPNAVSQSALLVLNPGDQVNIRVGDWPNCNVHLDMESYKRINTFKGFLVTSLEI